MSPGPERFTLRAGRLALVEQHTNNPVEADHSRLEQRLRPMRGLRTDRTAQTVIAGHANVGEPTPRTLRDRHRTPAQQRLAAAFTELAQAI